jgi:hypothetical protein
MKNEASEALRGKRSVSYARSAASTSPRIRGDGPREFSAVVHCEIGSFV